MKSGANVDVGAFGASNVFNSCLDGVESPELPIRSQGAVQLARESMTTHGVNLNDGSECVFREASNRSQKIARSTWEKAI